MRASKGHIWKILAAAAIPLTLSALVSLAAFGAVDVSDPSTDVEGSDGQAVQSSTQADCQAADSQCQTGPSLNDGGEDGCFLTVLTNGANSYVVLNEHVSDLDRPDGGVAGNQNALDRICFRALARSEANTTLVPGKSGDAPGKNEKAAGEGNAPGKSEEARGDPEANGQAGGQGQANADANGNGASGSSKKENPN